MNGVSSEYLCDLVKLPGYSSFLLCYIADCDNNEIEIEQWFTLEHTWDHVEDSWASS